MIGQIHQLANVLCNKLGQCFQSTACCDCNVDVELFADVFQTLVNFAKFSNVAIEQSCKTVDVDFFDVEVSCKHTLDEGKDILSGEDDTNYTKAKQSVRQLMGKFLEYEDDNTYKATQILNEVDVDKVAGKMVIQVNRNVWNAMLDFSKGFRKYELETATRLRGKYSLRIYKLVSKQTQPITYLIEDLRKMWGLTDKYKKVDDFIKNTIVAAKEELDKVSPYSFDYVLNSAKSAEVNKGRKGRPAITSVTFFPIHRLNNESTDAIRKKVDPSMMLDKEITDLLRTKFDFDWAGIKANISLFDIASKEFDLYAFLQQIAPKALRAVKPQGYVINAIKKHLSEHHGILIEDGIILQDKKIAKKATVTKKEPTSLKDIFGVDEQ